MAHAPIVHVIDDDDAVRESLSFLLTTSGFTVRSYDSGVRFLEQRPAADGDCIITDVRMPGMSGLELAARLRETGSKTPVIVITGHGDVPLAVQAMKAGAANFIEKPFEGDAIIEAVESALSDRSADSQITGPQAMIVERLKTLSARERDVLDGLVAGKANKVVAQDLGISPRTVEVYRAHMMTKMQAASLSELVRMALIAERIG